MNAEADPSLLGRRQPGWWEFPPGVSHVIEVFNRRRPTVSSFATQVKERSLEGKIQAQVVPSYTEVGDIDHEGKFWLQQWQIEYTAETENGPITFSQQTDIPSRLGTGDSLTTALTQEQTDQHERVALQGLLQFQAHGFSSAHLGLSRDHQFVPIDTLVLPGVELQQETVAAT